MTGKRKIILPVVIVLAALLAAAVIIIVIIKPDSGAQSTSSDSTQYYRQMDVYFTSDDGIYYTSSDAFLNFYDFYSEEAVIVCNKPNCTHQTWDEDTPEEERCHAYVEAAISGFVFDGQLYLLISDTKENTVDIVRSNLDRSEQTALTELDVQYIQTMVISAGRLYTANAAFVYEEDDDGLPVMTGETYNWLYMVDLQTGKTEEATERLLDYNAELDIIGVDGSMIYCVYDYFENKFDGTNFEEAAHGISLFSYNMETGDEEEILADAGNDIYFVHIYDNRLIGYSPGPVYEIVTFDLESGEMTNVAESGEAPKYFDENVIFKGEDGYCRYRIDTGSTEMINETVISEFYIYQNAGRYLYGSKTDPETGVGEQVLILKEDVLNGAQSYIYLDRGNEEADDEG